MCQPSRCFPKGGRHKAVCHTNGIKASTKRCVSLLSLPQRGVDTRWCASKDAGSQEGGGFGGVSHRLEKGTSARWAPKGSGL